MNHLTRRATSSQLEAKKYNLQQIIRDQLDIEDELVGDEDNNHPLVQKLLSLYIQEYRETLAFRQWLGRNTLINNNVWPALPNKIKNLGAGECLNLVTGEITLRKLGENKNDLL